MCFLIFHKEFEQKCLTKFFVLKISPAIPHIESTILFEFQKLIFIIILKVK